MKLKIVPRSISFPSFSKLLLNKFLTVGYVFQSILPKKVCGIGSLIDFFAKHLGKTKRSVIKIIEMKGMNGNN